MATGSTPSDGGPFDLADLEHTTQPETTRR